jgi:hypothetical protein
LVIKSYKIFGGVEENEEGGFDYSVVQEIDDNAEPLAYGIADTLEEGISIVKDELKGL